MPLTRRTLLTSAGAASTVALLAGCAGFTGQAPSGAKGSKTLTFTTWASDQEKAAYQKLIASFEASHTGVKVTANFVPYEQMFTNIDAQLSAGTAPDVFRCGYGQIAGYASQKQLLDLSSSFSSSESGAFIPAFWSAVKTDGKPYGVPQETDTSALVVNTALMKDAGITALPTSLGSAWSFDEFESVLAKLRSALPSKLYPFVDNWQLGGSPRWLTWLFDTGGRLLSQDLKSAAIDSAEGRRALEYTSAFFTKKYVPANGSVKSSAYADTTWLAGTTAMVSAGNFLLPEFTAAKFDWQVTYLPKDVRGADDLGGNALVATAGTKNPELATEFLKYMVTEQAMTTFCGESLELPTLTSLVGRDLGWDVKADVMQVFVNQATTITTQDVQQLTVPSFAGITTALTDQLEAAFRQGQSVDATLSNLTSAVNKALAA